MRSCDFSLTPVPSQQRDLAENRTGASGGGRSVSSV